jgi:predicted PurR-regulated permease PerM
LEVLMTLLLAAVVLLLMTPLLAAVVLHQARHKRPVADWVTLLCLTVVLLLVTLFIVIQALDELNREIGN